MEQNRPYSAARRRRHPAGQPGRCALLALALLLCTAVLHARPDSRGREFRFAFLPNYHDALFDNRDSLYMFIAAGEPTSGVIAWHNRHGQEFTHSFTIVDPGAVYTFAVPAPAFELEGFNNSGVIPSFNEQNEQVAAQSFHITAGADITVYAMSRSYKSSDAFLVLPVDALGTRYAVLSYTSNGRANGPQLDGYSTPSQFVVVATEDDTEVWITPSQPTWEYGLARRRVLLQAGECYLVQAGLSTSQLTTDLTGTRIASSRPVAVFAGHQRAAIPEEQNSDMRTRDHLAEHLPPVELWGYSALAIPYPTPHRATVSGHDLVRVLAYYDSTVVSLDGATVVLNGGAFHEQPLLRAMRITATAPILVAQYKKTSRSGDEGSGRSGDPFMMLIPPEEQFMTSYRFINPQVGVERPEPPFMRPHIFQEQYATIVVPRPHAPALRVDGAPVAADRFQPVAGTDWLYAHLPMSDGVHTLTADTGVGLYVYGYGEADSYGYTGGMNALPVPKDLSPPVITAAVECGITGTARDSSFADSGIRSVEAPESLRVNITFSADVPAGFPASAGFSARLTDPYRDGSFTLVVRDSSRLRTEHSFALYGFTVETAVAGTGAHEVTATTRVRDTACFDLQLRNTGTTTQTVSSAHFAGAHLTVGTPLPLVIAPGATALIRACFASGEAGVYRDTLLIGSACVQRPALPFTVEAVDDTTRPQFTGVLDTCALQRQATITDRLPTDWGLRSFRLTEARNALVDVDSSGFPAEVRYTATPVDPDADAIVSFLAVDEAGNALLLADTIQGRTLRAVAPLHTVATTVAYSTRYDSVGIVNSGLLPVVIAGVRLHHNTQFSAPLSQFPLVVPPQEHRTVYLVFTPTDERLYTDTVEILYHCAAARVAVAGPVVSPPRILATGCTVRIGLHAGALPQRSTLLGIYPHPADAFTTLRMASLPGTVLLRLYTIAGAVAMEAQAQIGEAGVYEIELDTGNLDNGVYIARIQTPDTVLSHRLMIRH